MNTNTTTPAMGEPAADLAPGISAAMRVDCQLDQAILRATQLHDLLQQVASLGAANGVTPGLRDLRVLTDLVELLRVPLNQLWDLSGEL